MTRAVDFGDNIRIVDDPATRESGHAGLAGTCWGITTPSVTRVDIIGSSTSDHALNVHFEDDDVEDAWFAPDLVEFVDHAPGTQAVIGERTFVRNASGEWIQAPTDG